MTENLPISTQNSPVQQPKAKVSGYVGAGAQVNRYATGCVFGANVNAGMRVDTPEYFLNLGGHVGTSVGANFDFGHEFDFKKDMGLELSAGASVQRELVPSKFSTNVKNQFIFTNQYGGLESLTSNVNVSGAFRPNDFRVKAAAKYTYKPSWGSIKVGVEGGLKNNYTVNASSSQQLNVDGIPSITVHNNITIGKDPDKKVKGYITPTVEAEVNLGKSDFSAVLAADMFGGNVGVKYNFKK